MQCKNCFKEVEKWDIIQYIVKPNQKFFSNSMAIPSIYYGYTRIPACSQCGAIIDYKNLSGEKFFNWLNGMDDNEVSKYLKGKALIRYFELDKLLELKKDVGDQYR